MKIYQLPYQAGIKIVSRVQRKVLTNLTVITAMLEDSFLITPILMNSQTNQDPLEYYPCSVPSPSISLQFVFFAQAYQHPYHFFIFSNFPDYFKKNCATEKYNHSTLRALHARVVWRFMCKFHQELNFTSTDWLSYLRTSVRHLQQLFPQYIFSLQADTLKSCNSQEICLIAHAFGQQLV